jgi:hypothetical protein
MSKTQLINELAMKYQTANEVEKQEILGEILELLTPYIKKRSNELAAKMIKGKAVAEDYESYYYQAVWESLEGKNFEPYDISKGSFIGYLELNVRSYIRNHNKYLTAEKRNIRHEGYSLDSVVNDDADNSLGEFFVDKNSIYEQEELLSEMYVDELLNEFAKTTKDGEAKAKALYMLSNRDIYTYEEIARVLGYDSYNANARKRVERLRESFEKFLSQKGY